MNAVAQTVSYPYATEGELLNIIELAQEAGVRGTYNMPSVIEGDVGHLIFAFFPVNTPGGKGKITVRKTIPTDGLNGLPPNTWVVHVHAPGGIGGSSKPLAHASTLEEIAKDVVKAVQERGQD